jgi:sulfur dioxygenase
VLFRLPEETLVYPAHDYKGMTASTIGEEKRLNPRVSGKSRAELIARMGALALPAPKKIAITVPAHRACGAASQAV